MRILPLTAFQLSHSFKNLLYYLLQINKNQYYQSQPLLLQVQKTIHPLSLYFKIPYYCKFGKLCFLYHTILKTILLQVRKTMFPLSHYYKKPYYCKFGKLCFLYRSILSMIFTCCKFRKATFLFDIELNSFPQKKNSISMVSDKCGLLTK